jgi:hypothetical protein
VKLLAVNKKPTAKCHWLFEVNIPFRAFETGKKIIA